MKLPTFKRIADEDMKDAPKGAWKDKLMFTMNLFMQEIYNGLSNGLTDEENMTKQYHTFTFTASAVPSKNTYSFAAEFTRSPAGLSLRNIQPLDGNYSIFQQAPYPSWTYVNGTINITGISGLYDGVKYTATVEVVWSPVTNLG